MIAGKFPQLQARLDPADRVVHARIDFHGEGNARWYYVDMKPEEGVFKGTLPKPLKTIGKVYYYIEAMDKALAPTRTEEYTSDVVESFGACADPKKVAVALGSASVKVGVPAGAPGVPAGFSTEGLVAVTASAAATAGVATVGAATAGGHATAVLLGVLGAGAVAGGVVAATHHSSPTPPPSVTGTWTGTSAATSTGNIPADNCSAETDTLTLSFTQSGSNVSGTRKVTEVSPGLCADGSATGPVGSTISDQPISGTVNPPNIVFSGPCLIGKGTLTWAGIISSNSMSGTALCTATNYPPDPALKTSFTWKVTRQ
jgi:hypothetical protein